MHVSSAQFGKPLVTMEYSTLLLSLLPVAVFSSQFLEKDRRMDIHPTCYQAGQKYCSLYDLVETAVLVELLTYITTKQFPSCGLIIVTDKHSEDVLDTWLPVLMVPHYTFSLDADMEHFKTRRLYFAQDRSGFTSCTTVVIACKSMATCRTKYSRDLYIFLREHGILGKDRRAFLYIQDGKLLM